MRLNGYDKLRLEQTVFTLASSMIEGYSGGQWSWARKFPFWYLKTEKSLKVCNALNYFEGEMTAKACGVGLCLIAASNLSFYSWQFGEYYHNLYDHVFNSGEFSKKDLSLICRLID